MPSLRIFSLALLWTAPLVSAQCIDFSKDPAGCQPSTFDTPMDKMPSVRVNKLGEVDPTASEADARIGAALIEERLHLFRNMQHIHWVVTVPSVKDVTTGKWSGGDMDGEGEDEGWESRATASSWGIPTDPA